jgi:hypothetical protein
MFETMAKRLHDIHPYLGMGLYYVRPDGESSLGSGDWAKVALKAPLILSGRQAGILIQKYETDSADHVTAMAGAWELRRQVLLMGRDGIIARSGVVPIGAALTQGRMTIVNLVGRPGQTKGVCREWPERAQIYRLWQRKLLTQNVTGELQPMSDDESRSREFLTTTTELLTARSHQRVGR